MSYTIQQKSFDPIRGTSGEPYPVVLSFPEEIAGFLTEVLLKPEVMNAVTHGTFLSQNELEKRYAVAVRKFTSAVAQRLCAWYDNPIRQAMTKGG